MISVSSHNAYLPGLSGPQEDPLRQTENPSAPLSEKSGLAINFAQSGGQGTSLESLSGSGSGKQQQESDLSQLVAEILRAILPLIQQLLQGQQTGNDATGSGGGNSPVSFGNLSAENGATQTAAPEIPVLSTAQTQGSPQATAQGTSQATAQGTSQATAQGTSQATAQGTGAASGGSTALSTGSSDLHLPDSLKPYEADIQRAAQATGVPANVLAAQIWQESRGNLGAATVNGGNGLQDAGLMQVNSNTFADLQSKNPDLLGANASPNKASDNIMAGALYMKEQLNSFDGSIGAALRAYNSGPNNVNTGNLSDISKTGTGDATYVDKVMDFANTIATGKGTLPA